VHDASISPREGMMLCLYEDGRVRATNGEWWRWCAFDAATLDSMVKDGIIEELKPPAPAFRKYKILENIPLHFLGLREQHGEVVRPHDDVTIECDGKTLWAIKGDRRIESVTPVELINVWSNNKYIEELR
jgi:hypothetical protein